MNELEALAEKERQEQQQREEQQQALSQQMIGLEQQSVTMDEQQRKSYKEKAISYQRNYETSLVQDMHAQAQRTEVIGGPGDNARPEEAPAADESWKEKRARVKLAKKAAADIKNYIGASNLAITPEMISAGNVHKIDIRVLSAFSENFQLDRHGKPATPADEEIFHRNQAFARDYIFGSEAERYARLDQMTNEVLAIELTPQMLEDQRYVLENAAKFKRMSLQLVSFESMLHDNRAYYDRMDPRTLQMVKEKTDLMASFGSTLTDVFRINSVQSAKGEYIGDSESAEENRADAQEDFKEHKAMFHGECVDYLLSREYTQLRTSDEVAHDKAQKLEKYGAYFENGATDIQYEELKKTRSLIAANPEAYAANKELVDHFYQEFYRVLEAAGESAVKGLGYASVALAHRRDTDPTGRELNERAETISDERGAELQQLAQYGGSLSDILRATLRGEPMTDEGQKIVAEYYEAQRQAHWNAYADEKKAAEEQRVAAEKAAEEEKQKAEQEAQEKARIAAEKMAAEEEKLRFEKERVAGWNEEEKLRYEKERIAGAQNLTAERKAQEETERRKRNNELKKLQVFGGTMAEKKALRTHVAAFERLQGKAPEEKAGNEIVPNTVKWRRPKTWKQSAQAGVEYLNSLKICANLSVPDDFKKNVALKTEKRSPFYLREFKLNEKGQPATKADEDILANNRQRCHDYATGDPALRKPLLDEQVQLFRNVKISPDEFDDPEKIVRDVSYYNTIVRLHLGILSLREENPEYFAAMNPELRDELQKKNDFLINMQVVKLYGAAAGMAGLDVRTRAVLDEDSIAVYRDVYNETVGMSRQKLSAYNTEQQAERLYRGQKALYAHTNESRRKRSGTTFPGGAGTEQYQEMLQTRRLIEAHPEQYAQNREVVDEMFKRLYANNALFGENEFRIRANQEIVNGNIPIDEDGVSQKDRVRCAAEAIEKLRQEQNRLKEYGDGIKELLGGLLEGNALTESGAMVLSAYNQELRQADMDRTAAEQKAQKQQQKQA